ncbi:MAG: UDP-3-O-acyl-N-acetylglucosamine deacetylase [Methylobacterium sp.]|jgi:UDP-3-O-[3-hydroxymyristoyl] N-acetylglucosamine deacetylase|nr:UDP-3-O-acyl-N-acetylglucosamine deacetylase [Methylobacterium sp.]MCA3602169.1 UDP-3-O-acyl-N-acetylglucosamine deacetylase [Methylobacterium sp.]MCA3614946.1 UDP-3-O-acyl-N-acetylglucosamine deacetylase [Methylobacterium sp.]MCA3625530.1 UDP-3-O-acyl-N-acetylglucosamine deacetylase [Methylobacterium sp.]MCA3626161.1 UDP-3-O-acyl-N-acetylglucosamine deacetylase [Methylobacterium sp.]
MKASLTPIFTIGEGNRAVTQTTLADQVVIEGIGVHRGQPARVVLHPAEANSGIIFLRTNLPNGRERLIEARHTSVQDTQLCTIIGDHTGASVATIEHLMSALAGLEIDNVLVEVDGPEMPILDGSSRIFVEQILQVGLKRLSVPRKVVRVLRPVRIEMGNAHAELSPYDGFRLDIEIDFKNPVIGRQTYSFDFSSDRYRREISAARTFGFMKDVEALWKAGLARGASLENTVAVGEDRVVNPDGLRFPNEFVRHKLLDAIGDLSLAGYALQGHYKAFCPGHKLNVLMLQALFADRVNYAVTDAVRRPARARGEMVMQPAAAFAPEVN